MMKKSDLKYLPPIARWSCMESEGTICIMSATVTVDETHNMNTEVDSQGHATESYLEGPIVF